MISRRPLPSRRAAFTLVEILAVLVIISILFVFVVTRVLSGEETVRTESTRQFVSRLDAAIAEYELEFGDYPPSTPPPALEGLPNATNLGAEMLFVSLYSRDWQARELPEERLVNSDDDRTKKSLTSFSKPELSEIADDWGNPIAYFHRRDYGKPQVYVTFDGQTGETLEAAVSSRVNESTGDPYNRTRYQLISAGPDGRFGTDDDIGNFAGP